MISPSKFVFRFCYFETTLFCTCFDDNLSFIFSVQPRLVHEMLAHETVEIACGANHMLAITCKHYNYVQNHTLWLTVLVISPPMYS